METTRNACVRITLLTLAALLVGQAALSSPASYEFKVLDENGRPVANAVVRLERIETHAARESLTDSTGVARFTQIDAGDYRVKVVAAGFLARSFSISLPADDESLTLEIRKDLYAQRVVVTSSLPDLATEERISHDRLGQSSRGDLAASLAEQPGLDATRRGTINLDPQVRGLQETEVAVFVDGPAPLPQVPDAWTRA